MTTSLSAAVRVALVCLVQLVLVAVAVFGQMSARLTGQDYLMPVEPVDPIDPFRGAYVALRYPGLESVPLPAGRRGREVYLTLEQTAGAWVASGASWSKPSGPAIRCAVTGERPRCGIESYFVPQDRARAIEQALADGQVTATVSVDSRGNAALIEVLTPGG